MITASNRFLKRAFLSLGLLLTTLYGMQEQRNIPAFQTNIIPLSLNKNDYISAEYTTSSPLLRLSLVDENNTLIRHIGEPHLLEDRFMFVAPYRGNYGIKIETSEKETLFTCNYQVVPLETKENSSSRTLPLSPRLQAMLLKSDTFSFWKTLKKEGTPIIEPYGVHEYLLTFVYQGAKNNVKIMGAPIGDIASMEKMPNNDIWYKTFIVPKGTRLSYQLAPDVPNIIGTSREKRLAILATLQADPLNKTPMPYSANKDKFNKVSTITLPDHTYDDWAKNKNAPQGTLQTFKQKSQLLENERDIDVYLPKDFSKEKNYPLLVLFDGKEYQSKVQTPLILDNLIATNKIPPLIAVFISNPSYKTRSYELPCNPLFADFMAHELLPWIKETITPNIKTEQTILSGSSYGGLASACSAFYYPELFRNVLSFSGSFWWKPENDVEMEWFAREITKHETKPIAFYLYAGLFETGEHTIDILEANRHLRTVLNAKNYTVRYEEFKGGHDYFSWRVTLSDGLIHIFKKTEH